MLDIKKLLTKILTSFVKKTGDAMSGNLMVSNTTDTSEVRIKNPNFSGRIGQTAPSSTTAFGALRFLDSHDEIQSYVSSYMDTSGRDVVALVVRRYGADGSSSTNHGVYQRIANDGKLLVDYASNDSKKAWIASLGGAMAEYNNSISLDTIPCAGFVSSDSAQLAFFLPFGRYWSGTPSLDKLAVRVRQGVGGYVYARSGTNGGTYTQLLSTRIWENGETKRTNEVESVSISGQSGSGFNISITFKYPLAKASGNTAAITNNQAVSVTVYGCDITLS